MDLKEQLKELRREIRTLATKSDSTDEEFARLETATKEAGQLEVRIEALESVEAGEKTEEKERQDEITAAVKAAEDKLREELSAPGRRLSGGAPYVAKGSELWKYDNLSFSDLAFMNGMLNTKSNRARGGQASEAAMKALAVRAIEDDSAPAARTVRAMGQMGVAMKADEVMQQDLTGFGDEWVGVAYSNVLWEKIRQSANIASRIPQIEIPQGFESLTLPTEGADPTFYVVAEVADENATTKRPDATVTSSKAGTANVSLTVKKMGARIQVSGELSEDSLIPVIPDLRRRLEVVGGEMMDNVVINGDTDASATTNINDIAGTPAATDLFLLANGFRKSALITTAANSRSGGALTVTDFISTLQLMGTAGIDGLDPRMSAFIIGPNAYYKALQLPEVLTRDVFVSPVLEAGVLTGIYGRQLLVSSQLHFRDSDRLANTSGLVDVDDATQNTTDSLLAVRFDQWKLGWKRRMTMESTRVPSADYTEIVALARWGLVQFSTEGAAISYNLTV